MKTYIRKNTAESKDPTAHVFVEAKIAKEQTTIVSPLHGEIIVEPGNYIVHIFGTVGEQEDTVCVPFEQFEREYEKV